MNLYDQVKDILETIPRTRNSDTSLVANLWAKYHYDVLIKTERGLAIPLSSLYNVPSYDTISRARRKIQNDEHLFLPTDEKVAKARQLNMEVWKKAMAGNQIAIFNKQ